LSTCRPGNRRAIRVRPQGLTGSENEPAENRVQGRKRISSKYLSVTIATKAGQGNLLSSRAMSEPAAPSSVRHVEVGPRHAGQRLDNFLLTALKGVPRSHIYRLLRKGEVRVNKGRAKPETRLKEGDIVRLPPVRTRAPERRLADPDRFAWLDDRILYEDDALLVIDKPPGLAVHGGSGVSVGLIEALRARRGEGAALELAHRLDRDTSGCLIIAKTREALLGLHRMLKEGSLRKTYLALLAGRWKGGEQTVEAALEKGRDVAGEKRVAVSEEGRAARSVFRPRDRFRDATLVEIDLHTGRTHQARVHAAHLGLPIAGDEKYGDRDDNRRFRRLGVKRLFLHAWRLSFPHPVTGQLLRVEAPLPDDLSRGLDQVRHGA
jgi:23S rRNA pseudouridine955/2504/2580 synthase